MIVGTKVGKETVPLYIDKGIYNQLMNVQKKVQKKDFDYLFCIDGGEGTGKSVLALQFAKVLDPNFTINQVAFTPDEFVKCVVYSKPHQCIVFDEAFTGLSSRSSLSEINNLLVQLMMEMRQKNLFVIIVLPTIFMLDKYVALHRAKCLFHVVIDKHGNRGLWLFYNYDLLKKLYLRGKRFYDYSCVKQLLYGKFKDTYMVDEKAYRLKKFNAIKLKNRERKVKKYKFQRDALIKALHGEFGLKYRAISELLKEYDVEISERGINSIIKPNSDIIIEENEENTRENPGKDEKSETSAII